MLHILGLAKGMASVMSAHACRPLCFTPADHPRNSLQLPATASHHRAACSRPEGAGHQVCQYPELWTMDERAACICLITLSKLTSRMELPCHSNLHVLIFAGLAVAWHVHVHVTYIFGTIGCLSQGARSMWRWQRPHAPASSWQCGDSDRCQDPG